MCGVTCPYKSGGCDGYLLICRYVLCRLFEVADVGNGDEPLEGGRPEENGEGAGGVQKKAARGGTPRKAHHHVLDRCYDS